MRVRISYFNFFQLRNFYCDILRHAVHSKYSHSVVR
jgi:hypothetical protein